MDSIEFNLCSVTFFISSVITHQLIYQVLFIFSFPLVKESGLILLQTIPAQLDVASLKSELFSSFPDHILNVHEMHVWCLVPGNIVATLHIIFQSEQVRLNIYRLQSIF